jgi:hypothetical protein
LDGQLEIGKRTHSDYTSILNAYVRPTLGLYRLSDIRSADVKKLYKSLLDKGLSARTVRCVHTVLAKALKEADCLDASPTSKVKLPKPNPKPLRFLLAEEVLINSSMPQRMIGCMRCLWWPFIVVCGPQNCSGLGGQT